MMDNSLRISKKTYRNVFLVQNRDYWRACPFNYDKEKDLVLSFDFAVVNLVESAGGEAQYIDHIVNSEIMEQYNYKTYAFFANWHYNIVKKNIFKYRGIDVGRALRIEIWNDITYYVRLFVCLSTFFKIARYQSIYEGIADPIATDIIQQLNIDTIKWFYKGHNNATEYSFPIFELMEKSLHPSNLRHRIKVVIMAVFGKVSRMIDKSTSRTKSKNYIYIQDYHPTRDIIERLKKNRNIKMVRSGFNDIKDMLYGHPLPIFSENNRKHKQIAKIMLETFDKEKSASLFIDLYDISNELYKLIIKRISPLLAKSLNIVDATTEYFADKQLRLMVSPFSLGIVNNIMISYCKKNKIPVYTVINGLLANSFLDEAKDGTWINAYGKSVKKNYFKGMENIVCLGDPRMDIYSKHRNERRINYSVPIIGIGTSLFSNVDLNSYLAVEFDFLNDIMTACKELKKNGRKMDIIIKLRGNNYVQQYRDFLSEYYPDIPVSILSNIPMIQVYEKVDLYISLASQTLFEASCFGIPVLYYKNDNTYYHTPFDGNSELVTALTPKDLINKIEAFYNRDEIYGPFKNKAVMEKYIGPLDGQNLERNMNFIYQLISNNKLGNARPVEGDYE